MLLVIPDGGIMAWLESSTNEMRPLAEHGTACMFNMMPWHGNAALDILPS